MLHGKRVTRVELMNGQIIEVANLEGLNYCNGVPFDYGVKTIDGRTLIIPRGSVASFEVLSA